MINLFHIDLFSGIGGFALAARWAGTETVQFVEIDPFCRKVLTKNFPGVPIHDDIKTFTYAPIRQDDERGRGSVEETATGRESGNSALVSCDKPFLLTGGFPCQPFSCAGKRRGKEDDRYLWPEMLRVIREAQPINIIGENVAGFINMAEFDSELKVDSEANLFGDVTIKSVKRGRGILDRIICQLEEIGYQVQAFVIPACAVGAPHRRDRVWIVAHNISQRRYAAIPPAGIVKCNIAESFTEGIGPKEADSHAPDTNGQGLEIRQGEQNKHGTIWKEGETTSEDFSTGQWQEQWLEVATRLCRVDDGVSRQVDRVNRLKALGNAIVPQIAYEIMKAIIECSKGTARTPPEAGET